ncbi:hypothetical protein [Dactylosporangium darangshiense]|uniref:Integral membrane protein n=1 Tax=Dactylosporangium darangshiense TaxID=579108 RepID=A0ABP8DWW2_9ACTN
MRGSVRDALSVVVGLAGIVALWFGLDRMLDTGSCSSGGPYISTRTCPDDTIWWTLLLIGGLLAWVGGLAISRQGLAEPGTGQLLWAVGFAGLGIALLLKAAFQDSVPPDARLGAYIIGGVFIPMGLGVGVSGLVKFLRDPQRR